MTLPLVAETGATRRVQFEVPGVPQPQGSTKSFMRGGKVVTTSDNVQLRPWRDAVCWHARQAAAGTPPFEGPVVVSAVFWLPRPAGHFGRRGLLPSAPPHPDRARKSDLDKLLRGVLDALTEAGVWRDDNQVVAFGEVAKRYSDKPGACIAVEPAVTPT